MDSILQLKLAMMVRLLDFLRAYPLGDEPGNQVVARFTEKVARLRALVDQQRDGLVVRQAQNDKHKALRRSITRGPLRQLAAVATSLREAYPDIAATLSQPVHAAGREVFLGTVRSIEATAQAQVDLLRSNGMVEGTPQDLVTLRAEYEQAVSDANAGRRAHTGARAEIRSLSREVTQLIRQLDGIVVYHFRNKPEVVGAWTSARNVAWPLNEAVRPPMPGKEGPQLQ